MRKRRRFLAVLSTVTLGAGLIAAVSTPVAASPSAPDGDLAVTTVGDAVGLHVLVAPASTGYAWRDAASLSEPGFDTDEWIGQACVTGSGRRAVVVYAPRQFTNREAAYGAGAFVAVVDLIAGTVHKLDLRASLAYYNPGCGRGEQVAVSALRADSGAAVTTVALVDATSGTVTRSVRSAGQLSSAVPFGTSVAAALGDRVVSVDATGEAHTLATLPALPFRLHPDAGGGLAFEVPIGSRVDVRRYAGGQVRSLGTGQLDSVRVAGNAGRVFLTGPDADRIAVPTGSGWQRLGGGVDSEPSTTGALMLSSVSNHNPPGAAAAAAGRLHTPQRADRVYIHATLTASHKDLNFSLVPEADAAGHRASPGLGVATRGNAAQVQPNVDPSTVPWDPDRACAVPRNDAGKQVFQATARQVEWAADLAVQGALTVTRPANFRDSGMPVAWSPQALIPRHPLDGGDHVPVQVLLGVLAQESNTMQASPHAVDGITGNVNQGGFYGDWSSWSTADCGYGVGQVTTGMSVAEGDSVYTAYQQLAIAADYASNIAASLNALIDKWNQLKAANIVVNNGDPRYVQNWWLAAWAYNSGVQPRSAAFGNPTGCTPSPSCTDGRGNWGLGWANNPANPMYPADRHMFHIKDEDTKTPNLWPYEELVMGWAKAPVARFDYGQNSWQWAYAPELIRMGGNGGMPADFNTFCTTSANHCLPNGAHDINGKPGAGLCQESDLHCWWHQSITWTDCPTNCGTEIINHSPGDAEPGSTDIYPADCSMSGMPNATVIVDDVTTPSVAPCNKTWTDQGGFTFNFPASSPPGCTSNCIIYPGKIDLHQIGVGFGGHIWFTHLGNTAQVVGTWRPPSTVVGWKRIKVHIPDNGATTEMADYQINLGNGQTRHRLVNQDWWKNTWVDLGTFNLSSGASVSLSNTNSRVAWTDGRDLAYDAVAFIPSTRPTARYVALGDSYSAGEGLSPYESSSDQYNDGTPDSCHRSSQAYPYQIKQAGHASTIAAEAAANTADFHFQACSGAETTHLTAGAVEPSNTDNTNWRVADNYRSGEPPQIDAGGWLDQDTTLATVSIGGNDVGFQDVLIGCYWNASSCMNTGFHLTRTTGRADPQALTTYEPYLIGKLQPHLEAVYRAVHTQAPNARLVVLAYPRVFADIPLSSCQLLGVDVQVWMNQMSDLLAQTINRAAATVRAQFPTMNLTVVETTSAFRYHRICDVGPSWINGITAPTLTGSDGKTPQVPGAGSFHPTIEGQQEFGVLVNSAP